MKDNHKKTFVCSRCGAVEPIEKMERVGEDRLCEACIHEFTSICEHCCEVFYLEDNAGGEFMRICPNCSHHYVRCEGCGRVILLDDAVYLDNGDDEYYYCEECMPESNVAIHNYCYKPKPVFFGEGPRYFGVELEIDYGGEDEDNADRILDVANHNSAYHMYAKRDGSLEEGFELVTAPFSLDYHLNKFPWGKVLDKAIYLGYTSHTAKTCGLHIHVSRKAFGETVEEQDACIARVLYFFESHWNELLRFSRRTESQLNQWAARYGYKEHPKDILDHVKKGYGNGRYTCINLLNTDTIEFRIFRGSLKLNTLLATLQMVNYICDVAIFMSDDEMRKLSWSAFVSGISHPELIQYLKERRLYISDKVDAEEEI